MLKSPPILTWLLQEFKNILMLSNTVTSSLFRPYMFTNVICFPPMITFKANILSSIIWTESIISTLQFGGIRIATPSLFELFPLKTTLDLLGAT